MASAALPPGPRGRRLRNFYQRLSGYAEFMEQLHREYGDIVFFELPALKCCAVFDADLAQEVLVAQADSFVPWAPGGREPNKLMEYGCLPVHCGEEHRWRAELMRTAFDENRNRAYAEVIADHARRLCERLRPGQVVDLRPEVERYTWDALAEVVLGKTVAGRHGLHIGRLLKAADLLDLMPFGQFMKKIGPPPDTEMLDKAIYGAIERARDPAHDGRDITAHLARAGDRGLVARTYENDRALRDEVVAFLCAFTDAPTATLCYAFYHLACNPEVRARAEREVDGVAARARAIAPADLERMPYVHAVFRETLRCEPPAYVMRAKEALEDCAVGGYFVPKGTLTFVGMRVMHHKAEYWEDPGDFRPERWLANAPGGDAPCPEHAYIPFGSGPHGCAGADLATMLVVFAVAAVAQGLRLEPTSKRPPQRENVGVGVDRCRVTVRERSPPVAKARVAPGAVRRGVGEAR